MSDEEFDIEIAVRKMQEYWATYDKQPGWKNYSEKTFLHDALYGIGCSMDPYYGHYYFANGFRRFISTKLYDFVEKVTKQEFIKNLKRKS